MNEVVPMLLMLHPDGERGKCGLSGVLWPEAISTHGRLSPLTSYVMDRSLVPRLLLAKTNSLPVATPSEIDGTFRNHLKCIDSVFYERGSARNL